MLTLPFGLKHRVEMGNFYIERGLSEVKEVVLRRPATVRVDVFSANLKVVVLANFTRSQTP